MTINISPEQVKFLKDKGFNKEDIEKDIEGFTSKGFSDDEIQAKLNGMIDHLGFKPSNVEQELGYTIGGEDDPFVKSNTPVLKGKVEERVYTPFSAAPMGVNPYMFQDMPQKLTANEVKNINHEAFKNTLPIASLAIPQLRLLKGAPFLNSVANAAIQGGALSGVESLLSGDFKQAPSKALTGAGIASLFPAVFHAVPAAASYLSEPLAGIPKKLFDKAINAERAGKSLFSGTWNSEHPYSEVSKKMNNAIIDTFTPEHAFIDVANNADKKVTDAAINTGNSLRQNMQNMAIPDDVWAESYKELGDKANEGIKYLRKKAGSEVGKAVASLENYPDVKFNADDLLNTILGVKGKFASGGSTINAADYVADTNYINKLLKDAANPEGNINPASLHWIKSLMQDKANYNAETSGIGNQFYKSAAEALRGNLNEAIPEYADANKAFEDIVNLEKLLPSDKNFGSAMSDYNDAKSILNGNRELLGDLDSLLPDDMKFLDSLKKTLKKEEEYRNFIGKLSNSVMNNASKLDNAPLDVQDAFNALDEGTGYINNFRLLQKDAAGVKNIANQTKQQEGLLKSLLESKFIRNPELLKNETAGNARLLSRFTGSEPDLQALNMTPKDAFIMLDELAAPENKFSSLLDDIYTRNAFESWMPAKGYTTGGGLQGIGNAARSALLGSTKMGLLPIFSPKLGYKTLIRINPLLEKSNIPAAASLLINQRLEK